MPSSSQKYNLYFFFPYLLLFQINILQKSAIKLIHFLTIFIIIVKNFVMATVHKKMTICRLLIRHDRETLRHNGFITRGKQGVFDRYRRDLT